MMDTPPMNPEFRKNRKEKKIHLGNSRCVPSSRKLSGYGKLESAIRTLHTPDKACQCVGNQRAFVTAQNDPKP
jgi:hypothetical protein